jgi:hypothetical protein
MMGEMDRDTLAVLRNLEFMVSIQCLFFNVRQERG